MPEASSPAPWWKRFGWFVLLWAGGVLALGAFAYGLRWLMRGIGMSL